MKRNCSAVSGLLVGFLLVLAGCATSKPAPAKQIGESVVFMGDTPAPLIAIPLPSRDFQVRSTFLPRTNTVVYVEGQDYVVDWVGGTLRRTPDSRLPDFRTNILFGAENFDHSKYPGFGNTAFFAFVDYEHLPGAPWPIRADQSALLPRSRARLGQGGPFKVVAFGDSITAGGDATEPGLIFWERWTEYLQTRYPSAIVTAVNGATGGDSTVQGLQRLADKVIAPQPDLVLIGFGMNDHNRGGVPVPQFAENLRTIIERIRAETTAEIVLFSGFRPIRSGPLGRITWRTTRPQPPKSRRRPVAPMPMFSRIGRRSPCAKSQKIYWAITSITQTILGTISIFRSSWDLGFEMHCQRESELVISALLAVPD